MIKLDCSVYEFYNGSLKKFSYLRQKLKQDGKSLEEVEETMEIEVKPGDDEETVHVFPQRGNEAHV